MNETDQTVEVQQGEGGASSHGWHRLESFLLCPKMYQLQQVRGIKRKLAAVPDAFAVGTLFHCGRASWFANGFGTDEATFQVVKQDMESAAAKNPEPVTPGAQSIALRYIQEYIQHWRMRPNPRPIATEYLLGPTRIAGEGTERTARLDDIGHYPEADGRLCIGEAKTTSTTIADTAMQYEQHGQPMLQALLWRLDPLGEATHGPIAGVMLDIVVKGYDRPCKFGRVFVKISQRQLDWYSKGLESYLHEANLVTWNSPELRNITACTRMIGRMRRDCPYKTLCAYGQSGAVGYVGADGESLLRWKPSEGQFVPPWD